MYRKKNIKMTNKKHINLALIMLPVFLITAYFTGGMMTVAKFDSIFGLTAGIPLVSIELIHTSVVS
ncbi:MAG: hypothetical protein DRP42_01010 [Tenericutes bacterium]|nr:MAG: hypothetical protein DRP42_01010 [Mycoplasmatota bacterium]